MKNNKIKLLLIGFLLLHPVSSSAYSMIIKLPSDPFYRAVFEGESKEVESFLKKGVSQEKKNTALGKVNHEKTFNLLIKYGADVNAKDKEGNTPLYLKRNSKHIVKLLIENGADVNAKNNEGNTPLYFLKLSEHRNPSPKHIEDKENFDFYWNGSAKLLIDNGADVNARNNKGETPLFYSNHPEFAKLLIKYGADVNARNNDSETPLFYVKKLAFAKLFIDNGADVNARNNDGNTPLHLNRNYKSIVKLLIEKGVDVNARNNDGNTPLHNYKRKFPFDFLWVGPARLLIKNGADVNAKNNKGETPLFYAREPEFAKLLIKKQANVNIQNKQKDTALHKLLSFYLDEKNKMWSANAKKYFEWKTKYFELIKLLIENGANVNARNKEGNTPLFYVGEPEFAKLLIKKQANVNIQNKQKDTALHKLLSFYLDEKNKMWSANAKKYFEWKTKYFELIKLLIENGANVNARNKEGNTPLFYVGEPEFAKLLIKKQANVNIQNKQKDTALHKLLSFYLDEKNKMWSANAKKYFEWKTKYFELIKLLIENGANVNARNKEGNTPLFYVGEPEFAKLLIKKQANVNIQNKQKDTALHKLLSFYLKEKNKMWSANTKKYFEWKTKQYFEWKIKQYFEMIKLLIENEANVNARNNEGNTPIFYVGEPKFVQLLIKNGADVNIQNENGDTALHKLISFYIKEKDIIWNTKKYFEMIKLLIENGADIKIKDKKGKTSLDYADFITKWKLRFYLWTNKIKEVLCKRYEEQ